MRIAAIAVAASLALTACTTYPEEEEPETASCGYDSRNWQATIDRMPGPGAQPMLHITGEVDMPTPGYTVRLVAGPADRMMPPGLHFRFESERPDGIVPQVIAPTKVEYREQTPYSEIRRIIIGCGDETLATISPVPVVQ
ncbi:hypothetical protein [Alteriqipengyuania sp.]